MTTQQTIDFMLEILDEEEELLGVVAVVAVRRRGRVLFNVVHKAEVADRLCPGEMIEHMLGLFDPQFTVYATRTKEKAIEENEKHKEFLSRQTDPLTEAKKELER